LETELVEESLMNTQDISEVRQLRADEIEDVSGALLFIAGRVVLKVGEGGVIFGFGVDNVGNVIIDGSGIHGTVGKQDYSLPPAA